MKIKLILGKYDKNNNLLFKVKDCQALFIMDFSEETIRLIEGSVTKSIKRNLRKYMHEHHDLKFI